MSAAAESRPRSGRRAPAARRRKYRAPARPSSAQASSTSSGRRSRATIDRRLPWKSYPGLRMRLITEGRFERPLRHDDVKRDVEGREHRGGEHEGGEQRFPQRDTSDHPHEADDQKETRDIEPEELRG